MTIVQALIAWLGAGSLAAIAVAGPVRRVWRSYWCLLSRHAVLAMTFRLVRPLWREAVVHGMKWALLEVVSPPVASARRVPARVEVTVPGGTPVEPGVVADLRDWLVDHAQRGGWRLPAGGRVSITVLAGHRDGSRRPYARVVTRQAGR